MSLTNENIKKSFRFYIAILQLLVATWATFVIAGGTFKMKLIPLGTSGKFAFVDDEDFDLVSKHKWHIQKDKKNYYATTSVSLRFLMHRLIMGCTKGDGKIIDHIDGNGLNNQKSNLRFCTNSQNCRNKRAYGTSKYLGVSKKLRKYKYINKENIERTYVNERWIAQINSNGRRMWERIFKTEEAAALAYNEAAKKYHGEFARLNIVKPLKQ